MNDKLTSFIRYAVATLATAIAANSGESVEAAINTLMQNIASGDPKALVASGMVVFCILWSQWDKLTGETKEAVVKKLSFKK